MIEMYNIYPWKLICTHCSMFCWCRWLYCGPSCPTTAWHSWLHGSWTQVIMIKPVLRIVIISVTIHFKICIVFINTDFTRKQSWKYMIKRSILWKQKLLCSSVADPNPDCGLGLRIKIFKKSQIGSTPLDIYQYDNYFYFHKEKQNMKK